MNMGKLEAGIIAGKAAMAEGKKVIFAGPQSLVLNALRQHFPRALYELVEEYGIIVHERKK